MRKILGVILSMCMLFTSVSLPVSAENSQSTTGGTVTTNVSEEIPVYKTTETDGSGEGEAEPGGTEEVSRLEWLTALTTTFEMAVEEDNYPDNYFSDIDSTHENYYEIMLATEFGLVDVEAGGEFRPDDAATREFAAHTLNLCLGYTLEDGAEYTFSEKDTVTYPVDIQVALNRGWFTLVDGAFLPQQAITVAEQETMLADAAAVLESVVIDENYENTYAFVEGVTVLPEETTVVMTAENELTIYDCQVELKAGDIFGVVAYGFPVAYKANAVTVDGDNLIVQVDSVETKEAFTDIDVQGTSEADLAYVQALDEDVELTYIVGGTEENNWEDGIRYDSLEAVGDREISAIETLQSYDIPENLRTKYNLGNDITADIVCKISDVKADFKTNKKGVFLDVNAKVTFSCSVSSEVLEEMNEANSIQLAYVPVAHIGYVKVTLDMALSGQLVFSMSQTVSAGIHYEFDDGFRLVSKFSKKSFTIQVKAEVKVGIKLAIGINCGVLKGEIFGGFGAKASIELTDYTDGLIPDKCLHLNAYLYAEIGAEVSINLLFIDLKWEKTEEFYNDENSPVRIVYHYEDGEPVGFCRRDAGLAEDPNAPDDESGSGSGSGSSGSTTTKKYSYYTPPTSQYGYNGSNTTTDAEGNTYTLFDYSLDDENNATITSYNGNVSALSIPGTLDGYTVVGIASNVFKNNTRLRMVIIPDSVTYIGTYAFSGCSNLESVTLSANLTSVGYSTFANCDNIVDITIPKKLSSVSRQYANLGVYPADGMFTNCDGLKNVTFESGTTAIASTLFANCPGIEKIVIPDTVTTIKKEAFTACTNLKTVEMPDTVTAIGSNAFDGCVKLENIVLSDSITSINNYAFNDCFKLTSIKLPSALTSLGYFAFGDCDGLTSIEIPKGVTSAATTSVWLGGGPNYRDGGPFTYCDNLKEVSFEAGTKTIASNILTWCIGVEKVIVPDTVIAINGNAFKNCYNLKTVELPDSVTAIAPNAFYYCTALEEIELPKYLVEIGEDSFYNCDKLAYVKIPKTLEDIWYSSYSNGPFTYCDGLKEVAFEEGTTVIVDNLFKNCTGLEKVTIPNSVTEIGHYVFNYCVNLKDITIPESVTVMDYGIFKDCMSLESIKLPENLQSMNTEMFSGCTNLKEVTLAKYISGVPSKTFLNCTSLETIELPDAVKTINYYAFGGSGLKEIVLPDKVTKIDDYAFRDCSSLTKVTMGDNVTLIGEQAFAFCSSLSDIALSKSVETIEAHAFYGCDALTSITLPNSVRTIGKYVLACCDTLTEVKLGSGLSTITQYAFYGNPALTKIDLPYGITKIEGNVFADCTNFTAITIPSATTSISTSAFSYPDKLTIYGVSGTYAEEFATEIGATFVAQEINATEIGLKTDKLTLNVDDLAVLELTAVPENFTDKVTWVTTDESIATVSSAGVVTAVGAGTATIKVYVGDLSASCEVTVLQPVTKINLNKYSLTMEALQTYKLVPTVYPSNANNKEVVWSSSDESVATVDENGLVTAVAKGSATIIVTAKDGSGINNDCDITVTCDGTICTDVSEMESAHNYENDNTEIWYYKSEGADGLEVTFDEQTKFEDGFDYLYVYDNTGTQIGKYTGTELAGQTITLDGDSVKLKLVTNAGGTEWGFKVTEIKKIVHVKATDVSLSTYSLDIPIGDSYKIDITVTPENHTDEVTWSSSDTSVATVAADGTVTAVAKGSTTITVTVGNVTAYCQVTVTNERIVCTDVSQLESSHNYPDYADQSWIYTLEGAETLEVTFHESTAFESNYDFLYVYDGLGNTVGVFTGENLAGKTITVTGDTVELRLTSDYSSNYWGFKVTEVKDPAAVEEEPVEFEDIEAGAYYESPVQWAVANGITNGYGSNTTFCPDLVCTRGQIVTFLWRAKGCPEPTSLDNPFTDVASDAYYYKAVLWAVEQGITNGYGSDTIFNPDGECTRGQVATFMWRAEGQPANSGNNPFVDLDAGAYYYDAVLWAVEKGVTNGYGNTDTFCPDVICTRGQIVTFLYRGMN